MSIEDIVDILSLDLIGVIPDDENVVVAANQGESLTGYHTPAGKAYENICRRIMGEDVPLACYPRRKSFFFPGCGLSDSQIERSCQDVFISVWKKKKDFR